MHFLESREQARGKRQEGKNSVYLIAMKNAVIMVNSENNDTQHFSKELLVNYSKRFNLYFCYLLDFVVLTQPTRW
ncbi:hypothetical protein BJP34_12185 [Moorena producens PAL-8-15-08-1]|uniref:Uncharacterized protein n=1 Tax=Moorena producens PAL-8-15-08-1 TaxID=1458985 RepID=A0A1D8TRA3_9CYAN|nr:hypothetical protein BJP34_12185 [Moorena producens PAL-8-15-08-1]